MSRKNTTIEYRFSDKYICSIVYKIIIRAVFIIFCYVISIGPVYWLAFGGYFGEGVIYFPAYVYEPLWWVCDRESPFGWPDYFYTPREIITFYITITRPELREAM